MCFQRRLLVFWKIPSARMMLHAPSALSRKVEGAMGAAELLRGGTPISAIQHDLDRCSGGKRLGTLHSGEVAQLSGPEWIYPRDFLLAPRTDDALPSVANRLKQFMGWCAAPTHIPVPVLTRASAVDPEHWSPLQLKAEMREALYEGFRRSIRDTKLCYVKEDSVSEPYEITSKELRILQVLGNDRGDTLVAATLMKDYTECDSELGEANTPRWFLMGDERHSLAKG